MDRVRLSDLYSALEQAVDSDDHAEAQRLTELVKQILDVYLYRSQDFCRHARIDSRCLAEEM